MKDSAALTTKYLTATNMQEARNLFKMSPLEALAFIRNKNMLPLNSQEHLIYKFKQQIPS